MDDRRQSGLWRQDPQSGYYEQQPPQSQGGPYQYYQPPQRSSGEKGRSFADRSGGEQPATYKPSSQNGVLRSDSRKIRDLAEGVTQKLQGHGATTSEQLAKTQHVNSVSRSSQPPLRIDPDAPLANLRNKPWSPEPEMTSPRGQGKPRQASNASELLRRGSVPDRSPLQKLEKELSSKEEKRARIEEAEERARQKSVGQGGLLRQGTLRSEKGRVVSDGSRRPPDETRRQEEKPRHASGGARQTSAEDGSARFRRASEALRKETSPDKEEYVAPPRQSVEQPERNHRQRRQEPNEGRETRPTQYPPASAQRPTVTDGTNDLQRSESSRYRSRARDAGYAGAASAIVGGGAAAFSAAERGRLAHERRKSQLMESPQASPISPNYPENNSLGRSGSKKLQKKPPPPTEWYGKEGNGFRGPHDQQQQQQNAEPHVTRQQLQTDRVGAGGKKDRAAAMAHQDADIISPESVQTAKENPIPYRIPPQTAAGHQAREQVGFGAETNPVHSSNQDKHHRFGGLFHRNGQEHRSYQAEGRPLEDWRNAGVARLTVEDLAADQHQQSAAGASANGPDDAWWEKEKSGRRATSSGSSRQAAPAQYDGPYEEEAKHFRPPLYLKCGPLLRYTGMRLEGAGGKEIWRGSIMIVTDDNQSDYSSVPTLRIFGQPADLHEPPPRHLLESGHELPPEYEDPIAGQVKVSRTGRPLYVRPVHEIEGGVDLSLEENNQGLYAATRTPMLGPQHVSGPDGRTSQHITFQDKSRIKKSSAEKTGRFREVKAARLHSERSHTFWRFNIEIELPERQTRVAYRINRGPALGFWVPGRSETMNMMFHSCNGFSLSVNPADFSGPDPLWRDVLNKHQSKPFHVMIGGGDQIYNDAAMKHTKLFAEWLAIKNPEHKHSADFSPEMQEELESFYLNRYAMWFSQGLFAMSASQIPMVNVWDDHDIIDGYGSYPHHFMASRVFTGVGAVAFKYYMLFQHQSLVAETTETEPSWVLGASPGPYISELSRSLWVRMGKNVAFMGLDCRTERMRDEILSEQSYDVIFDRARRELQGGDSGIRHLIVLLGVPIAYPRLNFLENILTSRVMDPIKALGRTGMLGGFVNKFDGGVEILDDLDDHWTAKHHKAERNWFIQELQALAAETSVRITILGGDVHLGAVGQFYTPRKFGITKDRDHRYMPNVISSAIVNTPPPNMMADVLNRRNKVHHLDHETDEDLIPMFDTDVDGRDRGNKCLLPRRNYAIIGEYVPGSTPPPSPRMAPRVRPSQDTMADGGGDEEDGRDGREGRRFPPGSMKRTMSLTRGPAALVRRLSGQGRSRNPPSSLAQQQGGDYAGRPYSSQSQQAPGMQRANSLGGASQGSYFPPGQGQGPDQRPSFHRRPTNLSVKEARKAAAKGGADDEDGRQAGHIDLEGGLDISLNMEIDQHDPSGATVPYRLLVPALWYEGSGDENPLHLKPKRPGLMERIRSVGGRKKDEDYGEEQGEEYSRSGSETPSPPPTGQSQGTGASAPQGRFDGFGDERVPAKETERVQRPVWSSATAQQPQGAAYNKGWNLATPPIGGGRTQLQGQGQGANNNPYPQSGYRRSSAPGQGQSMQQQQQPPRQMSQGERLFPHNNKGKDYGSSHNADDDDDLTPEDEYAPPAQRQQGGRSSMQARRPSKAERFFGIGDDSGPWGGQGGFGAARQPSVGQQMGQEGIEDGQGGVGVDGGERRKRRASWMVWR